MNRAWIIAKHELRAFFEHPTAYVLAIAFLGLGLFLSFRSLYASGLASLRPFFDLLPWLFAVFVPAVTMRSLAEERRSKSLEWLMAQPLGEGALVVGKFLGNWIFALVLLIGTLPMAFGVLGASDADPGIMVAQYVGAGLLAAFMVAVGLFASAATRNQITAFIVAAAISLALVLIGLPVVRIGLPPLLGAAAGGLSVIEHFSNVARGVIDLRDVLYFASGTALFLLLAVTLVSRNRLSPTHAEWGRLRIGAVLATLIVLVANLLGGYVRGRIDLTRDNLYTLSGGSRDILAGLDDLVTIKLFASRELPQEVQITARDVRDLLADMRRASDGNVIVEETDPDRDEEAAAEARSLGVQQIEFNVLRDDEFQVRRGWFGLAILYADERETIPIIDRTDDLEFRLSSAVSNMTRTDRPVLGWVEGFGGRGAFEFQSLRTALSVRFDIRTVDLAATDSAGASADDANPLDSVDVAVVAGPTEPLSASALERLEAFVSGGGASLLLIEGSQLSPQMPMTMPVESGIESLLAARGATFRPGVAFDLRSSERVSLGQQGFFNLVRAYPYWPVAFRGDEHATTRDLANLTFGWAATFSVEDPERAVPLWTTTEFGGTRGPGTPIAPEMEVTASPDSLGIQVLAVAIEESDEGGGRMIAVADANFLEEQFVGANPQNLVFAANAIDWLVQDESLIEIRSKDRTPPALVFESEVAQASLKWFSLIGVPLLLAVFGAMRVGGRERRARRRWEVTA